MSIVQERLNNIKSRLPPKIQREMYNRQKFNQFFNDRLPAPVKHSVDYKRRSSSSGSNKGGSKKNSGGGSSSSSKPTVKDSGGMGLKETTTEPEPYMFKTPEQTVIVKTVSDTGEIKTVNTQVSNLGSMENVISVYDVDKNRYAYDAGVKIVKSSSGDEYIADVVTRTDKPRYTANYYPEDKPINWSPISEIKVAPKDTFLDPTATFKESGDRYKYETGQTKPYVEKPDKIIKNLTLTEYKSELQTNINILKQQEQTTEINNAMSDLENELNKTKNWHPDTKIVKEGVVNVKYSVSFPYAGAEKYGTYKNLLVDKNGNWKDPKLLLATAFTGEDFLGLKSAYYTATGNPQKVIDTKIQAIYGTKNKSFGEFYFSSPMGVIGTSTAGGYAISKTLPLISAKGGATLGLLAKSFTTATFTTMAGAYIAPSVKKGMTTGDYSDLLTSSAGLGIAFAGGYAGFKMAQEPIGKIDIVKEAKFGKPERITMQKYLTDIGGKARLHFGKQIVMDKRIAWDISQSYAPKGRTWWGDNEIIRIPQYTQTRTNYLDYTPLPKTYTTQWGNKIFVETGKGWQPQTGIRNLPSTKVYPKPKIYRSYETHFITIDFTPYIIKSKGWDIKIMPSKTKPFHKTVKDVIKPDKAIEKDFRVSGGRTKTILKPPELKTVQKIKLETKTETLTIPKQLLKPVYIYKNMGVMQRVTAKKAIGTKADTKLLQLNTLSLKPVLALGLYQSQIKASKYEKALKFDYARAQSVNQALAMKQGVKLTLDIGTATARAQTQSQNIAVHVNTATETVNKTLKQVKPKLKMPQSMLFRRKSREFDEKNLILTYRFREFSNVNLKKLFQKVKI